MNKDNRHTGICSNQVKRIIADEGTGIIGNFDLISFPFHLLNDFFHRYGCVIIRRTGRNHLNRSKLSRCRLIQNTLIDQFQKPDGCLVAVLKTFFVEMIIAVFPRMIIVFKLMIQPGNAD